MSEHVQTMRLIAFFSVLPTMFLIESLWASRRWEVSRFKRLLFHFALSAFNAVIYKLVAVVPLLLLIAVLRDRGWGLAHYLGISGIWEVAATVVLFDFFDYWWHRFNHAVPFLWRFHRAHHLDTHVDVTTSLRFHIGELLLSGIAKASWILIWGPSVLAFAVFESGITAYAQFHHSNIDLPEGFERALRWLHMTPRLHAAHHTVTLRSRDANYSTIFLAWDYLFGTFQEADRGELKRLGLKTGRHTDLSISAFMKAPLAATR